MNKTTAPIKKTPSPAKQAKPHTAAGSKASNPNYIFVSAALDMSWRLAVAVLVPIIGGFELDKRLNLSPLLTVVGFLLAMGGMALVMWRTLQQVNKLPVMKKEKHP